MVLGEWGAIPWCLQSCHSRWVGMPAPSRTVMQTLFRVASYLVPPYSPIVHLNLPSQYQLKKHQWWPFSTDGTAAHAYSPVEGMVSRWVGDANCFNRRFHLIWRWVLLVVARSMSDSLMLKRSPGPQVRGMPSSTVGLPEGSFLVDFVTEYSYPSRKIELKGGFVLWKEEGTLDGTLQEFRGLDSSHLAQVAILVQTITSEFLKWTGRCCLYPLA